MDFVKLPLSISIPELPEAATKLVFAAGANTIGAERGKYHYASGGDKDEQMATNYMYSINEKIAEYITSQLPKQFIEKETPSVYLMKISRGQGTRLPPHVDRGRRAAINIYVKCNDERTVFYNNDDGVLKEQSSFIARAGEVWALDVSKLHAVLFKNGDERMVISLGYRKTKFSDLKKQLIRVQNG